VTADLTRAGSPLASIAPRLADVGVSSGGSLELAEVPFLAQVDVRVDPKSAAADAVGLAIGVSLPVEPGTSARSGELTVLWLGPDEWLVLGPPGAGPDLEAALRSAMGGEVGSLVDVSAQRTVLDVSGAAARDVLATGCALDLHERAFPEGACAQTLLARAGVVLLATATVDPAFRLLVRSSFAGYVAAWLLDAATEYVAAQP
jgi:sarcosine oxidase subunit gamma